MFFLRYGGKNRKNGFLLSFMAHEYIKLLHFKFGYSIQFGNEFFHVLVTYRCIKVKNTMIFFKSLRFMCVPI